MKSGVFTRAYSARTVEEKFRAAAGDGFSCVQFKMSCAGLPALPESIAPAALDRIAAAAQDHGVAIAAVSGTFNMIHPNAAERLAGLRALASIAAAAPVLGARVVTLCTGTRDRSDMWRRHPENLEAAAWNDLIGTMTAALAIAERTGVELAVEPEPGNVVADAARCRALLDAFPGAPLGVVFDPANLVGAGDRVRNSGILDQAAALLGGRILLVHAKNLGRAPVDYGRLLPQLAAAGFDGPVILQPETESEIPQGASALRRLI